VIVALGATAGLAVLGRKPAVMRERGHPLQLADGATGVLTVHPSYLLRLPDAAARDAARADLVDDLKTVRRLLA